MSSMPQQFFLACLILSVLLHLLVLGGPDWKLGGLSDGRSQLIESQLVQPTALPAAAVSPAPSLPEPTATPHTSATRARTPSELKTEPEVRTNGVAASAPEPSPPEIAAAPTIAPASAASEIAPPPSDTAPPLPRNGRIVFSRHQGIDGLAIGRTTHEWHHDANSYTLSAATEITGLNAWFGGAPPTRQASEGSLVKGELKPMHFTRASGKGGMDSADFNWPAGQVTFARNQMASVSESTKDSLTILYQLMRLLQRGEGSVAFVDGEKMQLASLTLLSEDTLQLGAGVFRTWHLRIGTGGPGTTDVWLGQDVQGLPVRIRQTDADGAVMEFSAEEVSYDEK